MLILPRKSRVPAPAAFVRPSPAYDSLGRLVQVGRARIERIAGQWGLLVKEGTQNLLTNPTCESGEVQLAGALLASNLGVARVSAVAHGGASSMRLTMTTPGTIDRYCQLGGSAVMNGLSANTAYTFSAWVYVPSGQGITLGSVRVQLFDYNGSYASTWNNGVVQTNTWTRISVTRTIRADATRAFARVALEQDLPGAIIYVDDFSLEAKPYATSFIDTTRAAETLTFPTPGILSPAQGYIRMWVYANAMMKRQVAWQYPEVFHLQGPNSACIQVWHSPTTAQFALKTVADDATTTQANVSDTYTPDGWRLFEAKWSAAEAKLSVDGMPRGTIAAPKLPSTLNTANIGGRGVANYLNTHFGSIQCGSNYPSDADSLAAYNAGGILPDANTTLIWRPRGARTLIL
jgi:hypothetical protein